MVQAECLYQRTIIANAIAIKNEDIDSIDRVKAAYVVMSSRNVCSLACTSCLQNVLCRVLRHSRERRKL